MILLRERLARLEGRLGIEPVVADDLESESAAGTAAIVGTILSLPEVQHIIQTRPLRTRIRARRNQGTNPGAPTPAVADPGPPIPMPMDNADVPADPALDRILSKLEQLEKRIVDLEKKPE